MKVEIPTPAEIAAGYTDAWTGWMCAEIVKRLIGYLDDISVPGAEMSVPADSLLPDHFGGGSHEVRKQFLDRAAELFMRKGWMTKVVWKDDQSWGAGWIIAIKHPEAK